MSLNFELHKSCLWHKRQLILLSTCMCDEKILKCAYIFCVTEAASHLTRSLKEAEAEKLSVEKKRLQTLQNVVSFADFVQKEGDCFIHIMHGTCTIGFVGGEEVLLVYKQFSVTFTKLQKATISFAMSSCPSIHMEQLGCYWTDFYEIQ